MSEITRPTVLVVDDERINRTLLAELLQDECRVILAKDGTSALQRVGQEKISLILLDAVMPDMDGYEVLRRLMADESARDIGVIFVTGQAEEEDEERGLRLGAVDYITKPIRPLLVKARVRNHLKLALQREELERLTLRDGLTGITNRRGFDQAFGLACRNAVRTGDALGLAMIDVDHFKLYNDHYGHAAGDATLRRVAAALAGAGQRSSDIVARYGGEEFALVTQRAADLPALLERARTCLEAMEIAHAASPTADWVTISCGGVIAAGAHPKQPETLLQEADDALYEAKRQGRNRTVIRDMPVAVLVAQTDRA